MVFSEIVTDVATFVSFVIAAQLAPVVQILVKLFCVIFVLDVNVIALPRISTNEL